MKKILLLIFLSALTFANYIPKDKVGICEGLTVFSKKDKCEKVSEKDCIKISKKYNCSHSEVKPDKTAKKMTESCLDEIDCQAKLEAIVCDDKFDAIKNLDSLEVYCTRFIPEHVGDNKKKKDDHEKKQKDDKDAEKVKKDAIKALREKLKQDDDLTPKELRKVLLRLLRYV